MRLPGNERSQRKGQMRFKSCLQGINNKIKKYTYNFPGDL